MLTASPITRQTVGRTFSVAISTLGVGATLQLGIIGWAFATRPANPLPTFPATDSTAIARINSPPQTIQVPPPDLTANPFGEPPQTFPTTPAPTVPSKPTPVPQRAAPAEPTNRFEEVLLQGRQLRERGDMSTAITKLREAATMDPKNPIPVAELAATYEKMGNADRAAEHWRKIYEMGDAAGVYFTLAETKLKVSQVLAVKEATRPGPDAAADTSVAVDGIAAGATLGLLPIRTEDEPDDGSAKRFTLHIPIKARPKSKTEVRDLVIHVLFYDIVDGQNVVQTSANVSSRWMTPPADWTESDVEELAVEYQLPKPEAKAAKRENRKYFGYIVRIYYKQQLQAATAEPERLSQQYPPPPTLPKDPDK
jgi:tetratricopeptide (TPR) repeat protein